MLLGLDGELVTAAGSGSGVGIELTGSGAGHEWSQWHCEGLEELVHGAYTGEVTGDVGQVSKEQSITFAFDGLSEPVIPSAEPLITECAGVGDFESSIKGVVPTKGEAFEIA